MAQGRSFLIDTNVIIQLEDDKPVQAKFSEMVRRAQESGVTLYVHEASEEDIRRDKDAARRDVTLSKIAKFPRISNVPMPPELVLESRFGKAANDHDRVDVQMLNALDRKVVDFLVTEDLGLHRRARNAGFQDRVLRVRDAVDWLTRTFEPAAVPLQHIVEKKCYQLDRSDPIFDTLRDGYPEFDEWIDRNPQRACWCLEVDGATAGIVIRKDNESRAETDATLPGDKILKVSTFKVKEEYRGEKFGEHLLKQILWYAQRNRYDLVYLTAFKEQQEVLADLLVQYGFKETGTKKSTGETLYEKQMYRGPVRAVGVPLGDDYAQYPCFREDNKVKVLCVPIQPRWYRVLFPENAPEPLLLPGHHQGGAERTPGNTIRKVYLCKAQMRNVNAGDVLLFYMSGNEIGSGAVRTVGIVENYREIYGAEDLLRATGRRSVYSADEQMDMIKGSPVKVLDFLLIGHLDDPIPLGLLNATGAIKGVPQSIRTVDKTAYAQLGVHENLGYA
ncbi:MAG TPA: GNAT family N-acetyltransferase [Candidatus Baltobacteraceae bacterium]